MSTSKGAVKAILQKNKKSFLSGEEIGDRLGLSRNAIWKAVRSLRAEGYLIDAETRKGYCLQAEPDLLEGEQIKTCLWNLSAPVRNAASLYQFSALASLPAFHLHVFQELDSTNQEGKRLAIAGAESGTVILADRQTAGRGRMTNAFASPAGGLYFSLLLRPYTEGMSVQAKEGTLAAGDVQEENAGTLAAGDAQEENAGNLAAEDLEEDSGKQAVYLAISDPKEIMTRSLAATCAGVLRVTGKKLTWQRNDLYLDSKKVGGILTESGYEFESGLLQWVVIGIGLNVKTNLLELPEETRERAGSLFPAEYDLPVKNELAAGILLELAGRLMDKKV
ncbi:HTH domain-containing protein [Lachnospiraceae bacterium YH-ros2228]